MILIKAFVLNTRHFKETSLIVELFTQDFGKISVVAKGAKRPKNIYHCILQPFSPLLVSWQGKTSLYTLTKAERDLSTTPYMLFGKRMFSGFYLNELLAKLLAPEDPCVNIFADYAKALSELQTTTKLELPLRYFEKSLLKNIGYELSLNFDFITKEEIHPDLFYRFIIDKGPVLHTNNNFNYEAQKDMGVYKGSSIYALNNNSITSKEDVFQTKILMRNIIYYYLDGKKIKVRELFE